MPVGADEIFRLSGVMFARTSVRALVNGIIYTGIKGFKFSEKREGVIAPGLRTAGIPLGITDGLYMPESWTLEAYVDTLEAIKQQLGAPFLGSYGDARFSLQLQISEPTRPGMPTLSYKISGMKIEGTEFDLPEDANPLVKGISGKFLDAGSQGEGAGLSGLMSYLRSRRQ